MKAVDFVRKMQAGGVAFVGSGIDEEKKRIIIQALSVHHHLIVIYNGEEDFNNKEVKFTDSDLLPTPTPATTRKKRLNLRDITPIALKNQGFTEYLYSFIEFPHTNSLKPKPKKEKKKNWWKIIGKNVKRK